MRSITRWRGGLTVWLSMVAAATAAEPIKNPAPAIANVAATDLLGHIQILASDAFEGRAPGSAGEERTIAYLTEHFRKWGLKPGNPDGTFVQEVPLTGFQASAVSGTFRVGTQSIDLKYPDEWVAVSRRMAQEVKIENSDVVFVGYGVIAPEYGWDDYKDIDVRGKTIVMLVNDPAVPDPKDPGQLDPALFKGKAMTYYGRWTYKYEIASEKGAAAALLVHETGPAGYPYSVVVGSWGRENFDVRQAAEDTGRVAIEAWIGLEPAKQLFAASGLDFDTLKKAAISRDFRPVPLNAKARLSVQSTMRQVKSRNVVARIEGSDPERKNEHLIYTAHWDHLGRDESLNGDKIYNGAADNASGVAAVLEIAKAFAQLQPPPKRSVMFLALTAEEQGLLGAKYYAEHPLFPLEETLATLNMDVINLWGRTRDITSVGLGQSTLDDLLRELAQVQGRVVIADAEPEKGLFYRSDHFEFAKQGVPALNVKAGVSYVGKPEDFGRIKREEYTQNDYHKVSDEVKADWDLTGAVEDLRLLWEVGHRIADGDRFPEWSPTSEFRERREAMLKKYRP